MANQSNGDVTTELYVIYKLFMDKSEEVLRFYYWTDEFFKGATSEYEGKAIEEANKWEQIMQNLPSDFRTLLDDIKTVHERHLKEARSTIESLHSQPTLLCKLCLVYVVGLFEAFLTDSAEQVLTKSELKKFKDASFKRQVTYLEPTLDIKIDEPSLQIRMADIDEVFARRNLLLHRGGKVDKHYLNRVGYAPFKEGEEVSVDVKYLEWAAYSFRRLASYLFRVFEAKKEENYGTAA